MRHRDLRLALIGTTLLATAAIAADTPVPQVKTQAPAYYRMMLGDFEVTVLSDGTAPIPFDTLMTNMTPEEVRAVAARAYQPMPQETSINAFLINTGAHLVLVDSGAGSLFGPMGGRLLANLKAAGYAPEQVEAVLITHLHGDHVGGLTVDGKATFPRATIRMAEAERGYWLDPAEEAKAPADRKGGFATARAALAPYLADGRVKTFAGETELFPGIKARPTPGHTPGHTLYAVQSKGERLVLIGDTVHVASVQFPKPSITVRFDFDSPAAAAARKALFAEAAADGEWLGGAHISFPGLGHVRAEGDGFTWLPAAYKSIR